MNARLVLKTHDIIISDRMAEIMDAIFDERQFQDEKHGSPAVNPHSVGSWLLTIEKELEEAKTAAVKGGHGRDNVINEIIQIAALCVACLEQHGVKELEGRTV